MKTTARLLSSFAFLILLALQPLARAQVAGAPATIDYQGQVLDSLGAVLAPTTPTNYVMKFRIYDQQTGGTIVWSESQTVTVDKGAFSVRLGNGVRIPAGGGGDEGTTTDLRQAFNATSRFLGLTVEIPAQTPVEVTPRLAFLSSPFSLVAERAKSADSVNQTTGISTLGTTTITNFTLAGPGKVNAANTLEFGAGVAGKQTDAGKIGYNSVAGYLDIVGAGTSALNRKIHLFAEGGLLIDGAATATSFTGIGTGLTALNATNITSGTLADARLSANIPKLNAAQTFSADQTFSSRLTISASSIGVGAISPKLDVGGSGWFRTDANDLVPSAGKGVRVFADQNTNKGSIFAYDYSAPGPLDLMLQIPGGKVGIGTATPLAPLHVVGSISRPINVAHRFDGPTIEGANANFLVTIKASNYMEAAGYLAVSDARIKDIVTRADSHEALQTVQKLQVTDYRMKDRAEHGDSVRKGFIAQEVQAVIPGAVTKGPGFVPDIFAVAEILGFDAQAKTLRLRLAKTHGLKAGDMVRLTTDDGDSEHAVTEIPDEHTVLVGGVTSAPKRLFVFGRRVEDFLSVDYNRIFTTGIAAIQQLKKEKDAENQALTEKNAALAQQLAATEKRLAALEAQVTRLAVVAEKPAIKTASAR